MSDDLEAEQRRKEREERRKLRALEQNKTPATSAEADKGIKKTTTPPVAAKAALSPADEEKERRREQRRRELEERLKSEEGESTAKSDDSAANKKREEEKAAEEAAAKKREAEAARKKQEEEEEARRREEEEAAAAAAAEEEEARRREEEEAAAAAAAEEEEASRRREEEEAAAAAEEEASRRKQEEEAPQRTRKVSYEPEESNGRHSAAASPAIPADDDDYEARMAARAARRAQRQSVAVTPTSSRDAIKSPPTARKEILKSPAATKTISTPPPTAKDTKPVQLSQSTLLKQKEFEADDLAAIAERKRLAVQEKEAERRKALESTGKSGEFKRSTSREELKESATSPPANGGDLDDLAAIAERKRLAVQEKEAERKRAQEGKTGEFKRSTSKEELKEFSPSANRSRFESASKPAEAETSPKPSWKKPAATAATVSAIHTTPVTRGKVNSSMFEKPAASSSPEKPVIEKTPPATEEKENPFGAKKFGSTRQSMAISPPVTASKEFEKPAAEPAPRKSVFDKNFEQEKPKYATVRAADLPSASKQVTGGRIVVVNKNPIVVGGFSAAASSSDSPTLNSPLFLFSKDHSNVKDAVIDFINVKLGNDVQLKNLGCVPLSNSNFVTALKTGILFCKLVNLVERSAVDERTINLKDLDTEKCVENFNLCINSARSAGCYIKDKPTDLANGAAKPLEDVAYAIVKGYLRKRIHVEYESTREKCKMCSKAIDGQHGQKGNIRICTDCMEYDPLKLINFFTGENAMETNEVKAKTEDSKKKSARQTMAF